MNSDLEQLKAYAKTLEVELDLLSEETEIVEDALRKAYERIDEMEHSDENS